MPGGNLTKNWRWLMKDNVRRDMGGWQSILNIPLPAEFRRIINVSKAMGQHLVPEIQPDTRITLPLLRHLAVLRNKKFEKGKARLIRVKRFYEEEEPGHNTFVASSIVSSIRNTVYERNWHASLAGVCCAYGVPFFTELPHYLQAIDEILALDTGARIAAVNWLTFSGLRGAGIFVKRGVFHAHVRTIKRASGDFDANPFSCRRCTPDADIFLYPGIRRQMALGVWYAILAWYVSLLMITVSAHLFNITLPLKVSERKRLTLHIINRLIDEDTLVSWDINYPNRTGDGSIILPALNFLCREEVASLGTALNTATLPEFADHLVALVRSETRHEGPTWITRRSARRMWLPPYFYRHRAPENIPF